MNILYFVHGFPPSIGAGAINAFNIVNHLAKFGHNVLVLSPGVFSRTAKDFNLNDLNNLPVIVKYSSKLMKIPLNLIFSHFENMLKFLLKMQKSFHPDIVLSQYQAYQYASVAGDYISKFLKIPHIIRSHDVFFNTYEFPSSLKLIHSIIYPRIFRSIIKCKIFYSPSTEIILYLKSFKKLKNINFKIHHNGIDTSKFYPYKDQDELKEKFGCENILLHVGTIAKGFGLQNIIKVLPEVLRNHKDTHFLIIGGGHYEYQIRDFIKKAKLTKQIHILGIMPHDQIPYYINNSTIGIGRITDDILWRYFIPVKCLEYMACKKTFITAPCSKDLIKNNDVGVVLKRNFTEKDIINGLNLLIEDKSLRRQLGENGLKKINQKFRWENLMKNFNNDLLHTMKNN